MPDFRKVEMQEWIALRCLHEYRRLGRRQNAAAIMDRSIVRLADAVAASLAPAGKGHLRLLSELSRRKSAAYARMVRRVGAMKWCDHQMALAARLLPAGR